LPIHVGPAGAVAIGRAGTLLGMFDTVAIHPVSVTLGPGDVVVFHTDGATDTPPPHDLDEAAWKSLVAEAARNGGTADEIADRIRSSLESILPFRSRDDDIALVVLVVTDPAATSV
jgi:serine phosphatase RsbU (regulator of sigma subunit)